MNPSDNELISSYLKGDKQALEILIQKNIKSVYSFIYHYLNGATEAEDITQEVFIKAWCNIKKFKKDKNFKIWLFSIAKNTCLDFFRKKKTAPFSDFDTEDGGNILTDTLADPSPLPQYFLERADISQALQTALNQLAPKHRSIMIFHYNDHLTFAEIAKSLNESLNTIKSRHLRAVIKLQKLLLE